MSLPATIGGGNQGAQAAPSGVTFHAPGASSHDQGVAEAPPTYEQPAVVAVPVPAHAVEAVEVEAPIKDEKDDSAPTPALEGWSLKLAIGLVIFKFILGIVLMSISIDAWRKLSMAAEDMAATTKSWSVAPLEDVISVASGLPCTAGYDAVPMIDFPGTEVSCDCPSSGAPSGSSFKTPGLYKQACNSSQTWCGQYNSVASKSLDWKGAKICTKKFADKQLTGLNRPRASSTKQCPSGYTPCNAGATGAEIFCTSSTCPITDFKISASATMAGYTCSQLVPSSTAWYLCKSSSTSPWPVVNSNVQDTGAPCWPGASDVASRSENDVRRGSINTCSKADPRWAIPDSQSPIAIYTAASLQNEPLADTRKYSHFMSNSVTGNRFAAADFPLMVVAAQSESRWAQTCPVSRAVVTSKVDAATSITKAQLAILILSVIGLIAINIVIGYYELKHLLSNEAEDEEDRSIHRKKNCCSILLGAGKIIPIAIAFGAASSLYGELHSITTSSPPCSDATTMQSFALLDETASGIVSKNRALIAIAIVEIIMTLYDCYKVAKQSRNDDTMFKV